MRKYLTGISIGWTALALSASAASAHEGHGDPGLVHSALHYLLEPIHLPLALGLLVALVVGWRRAIRGRTHHEQKEGNRRWSR